MTKLKAQDVCPIPGWQGESGQTSVLLLVILGTFLLASVGLAAPSSRSEARLARRRENRRSQLINRIDSPAGIVSNVDYSSNWAGAVWDEADVRIIPLIYDHLQSHAFSDRELSPL